ncbi:MAG: hypothetical protein Q9222_002711 [Ikaeria aurantiellina]
MLGHLKIFVEIRLHLCFLWERFCLLISSVSSYLVPIANDRLAATRIVQICRGENAKQVLQAQWSKDAKKGFILRLPFRNIHVLPSHYLSDYGWKSDDNISSNIDLRERILGRWTLLGSLTPMEPGDRTHSAVSFIKDSMTGNMTAWTGPVHDQLHQAVNTHIGDCPHWQESSAYQLGVSLNLQIYERVFVGLDLCKDDKWNAACEGYSKSAINTAAILMKYAWWQRPLIAPFVTEYRELKRHVATMQGQLDPILRARLVRQAPKSSSEANDFIDWWIEKSPETKRRDSYALTLALIQLNIAGIRSTGMVVMQALFDLAGRAGYTEPLLAELDEVISEHGTALLPPRAVAKLVKLDSFLKESQRHVAQNLLSIYRKVMSPLRLKDGDILPSGSYVAVQSIDPDAHPGSMTRDFDGFRWSRLRADPGNEQKFTAAASGIDSLEFGYGLHACPGRFFAMYTVKVTIAAILRKYELRLPRGECTPSAQYNSLLVLIPPKSQKVEFRSRQRSNR